MELLTEALIYLISPSLALDPELSYSTVLVNIGAVPRCVLISPSSTRSGSGARPDSCDKLSVKLTDRGRVWETHCLGAKHVPDRMETKLYTAGCFRRLALASQAQALS